MKKKHRVLKETTNRRYYNITNQWIINNGACLICSRRYGEWTDCWRPNDKEYDNPTKNCKYRSKIKKQWMKKLK